MRKVRSLTLRRQAREQATEEMPARKLYRRLKRQHSRGGA